MEELFRKCKKQVYVASYLLVLISSCGINIRVPKMKFHCAYIRYTVGLSVEEIWSVTTEPITSDKDKSLSESPHNGDDDNQSVELTFAAENDDSIHSSHLDNTEDDAKSSVEHDSDYEVIDDAPDSMDGEELDELDAEIARELAEIDDL